ncbi:Long-chain-fatty-acid--CoA ligase [Baekduia alba]|uniref:AMP-binding protein n=1 Tax=Baekduia alba TaxID=2997333 RepID=UPI002341488A|nr:AMP-binding protein [Baekduia alba]WCB95275.1 Long-chain-fatty-acid--CoA ligase [Baekduia alba]
MRTPSLEPLSPLRFLDRSAAVFPDKTAVVCGDRRLSYRELAQEATRVARGLLAGGLEPGDRVAYLCPNVAELLVAHFAVPLAGGVLVAINTRLSAPEIAYICEHAGARTLVVDAELAPQTAESVVDEVVVIGGAPSGDGRIAYDELRTRGGDAPLPWSVDDELATISINYTSGTTGRPKGVMYTHRGAYLNALGEVLHSGHTPDSVYLWTLPMFHCNGWCTAWGVTAIGGTHVCLRAVRGDAIWELLARERITHLNGAPAVLTTIARAPEAHLLDGPLTVTVAGAAPSPTTIAEMEALGAHVVHVYGLTEVYGPYSVCEWQPDWPALEPTERARRLARQGVGMITAERLRVLDAEGADVPADGTTMGEIAMRGNNVMKGYFRDPQTTAQAFAGGWFRSGDLGVVHPDGYVELLDRAKDIVISGGENISTVEVEQALLSHPAVLSAAVVGVPDDRWGERPHAYVVLNPGADAAPAALVDHVRGRLARFKAPDVVEVLDALPTTSTGKIQKYELRARARAAVARE